MNTRVFNCILTISILSSERSSRLTVMHMIKSLIIKFLRKTVVPPLRWFMYRTEKGAKIWNRLVERFRIPPAKKPDRESTERIVGRVDTREFYGSRYFDSQKDILTESGYSDYAVHPKDINMAKAVREIFNAKTVLDIGCAKGIFVNEIRKIGIPAFGADFSDYAVINTKEDSRPYLVAGDITAIPFKNNRADLVTCFETLEHLNRKNVRIAIDRLTELTDDKLWITVPSLGINDFGPPDGWPQGKMQQQYEQLYESDRDFPDPAKLEHLKLDKNGYPQEGHLTIASFRWWTENFLNRGFIRRGDLEKRINDAVEETRIGLLNSMVFEKVKIENNNKIKEKDLLIEKKDAAGASISLKKKKPYEKTIDLGKTEPGHYIAEVSISLESTPRNLPGWTTILLCDIRSTDCERMHGFRTVRLADFGDSKIGNFAVKFSCKKEEHLTCTLIYPGRIDIKLKNKIKITDNK